MQRANIPRLFYLPCKQEKDKLLHNSTQSTGDADSKRYWRKQSTCLFALKNIRLYTPG